MTTSIFIPAADITRDEFIAKATHRIAVKFQNDDELCFCSSGACWTHYNFELHLDSDIDGAEGDYSTDIDLADYADSELIPDFILPICRCLPDDYSDIFVDWLYDNFMRPDNKIFADICCRLAGQVYDKASA